MGKGVWLVFVPPRRIPCNVQGNKPGTLLAPETEKPHQLGPHPLLAQFSAEFCDRGLYSSPKTMLSSVLSRLFLFKVVSTEIKFSQELLSSVWTFEMDDQSLCTSLQNSWVSAFVSVF